MLVTKVIWPHLTNNMAHFVVFVPCKLIWFLLVEKYTCKYVYTLVRNRDIYLLLIGIRLPLRLLSKSFRVLSVLWENVDINMAMNLQVKNPRYQKEPKTLVFLHY